jgi:hypothetical protein
MPSRMYAVSVVIASNWFPSHSKLFLHLIFIAVGDWGGIGSLSWEGRKCDFVSIDFLQFIFVDCN